MAKQVKIDNDLLNKDTVNCTEIKGKIAELYEQLMDIADAIYKLREKPMKPTALFTEHVLLRLEELKSNKDGSEINLLDLVKRKK